MLHYNMVPNDRIAGDKALTMFYYLKEIQILLQYLIVSHNDEHAKTFAKIMKLGMGEKFQEFCRRTKENNKAFYLLKTWVPAILTKNHCFILPVPALWSIATDVMLQKYIFFFLCVCVCVFFFCEK